MTEVITRIAPSPTGNLHLGTVRTALYNLLFAKAHNGKFFFRLEDTDKQRSTKEFEEEIINGFKWLGISWDAPENLEHENGMLRQSKREARHHELIKDLLEKKLAYKCFASPEELDALRASQRKNKEPEGYDNRSRNLTAAEIKTYEEQGLKYVIRLNLGLDRDIKWDDLVRGPMSINTKDLGGDPVIQKFNGQVLYNFAVVVDDNDMQVSHVIRGEDHLTNTAKQIAIYETLNFPIPNFAHLPLIFTKDKQKLSKRKHGDIAGVDKYKKEGYLAQALNNYLVATSYTDTQNAEREVYTLEELKESFAHQGISKSPAIYDIQKLNWFNREYIAKLSNEEVFDLCKNFLTYPLAEKFAPEQLMQLLEAIRGNLNNFSEINNEVNYFFVMPETAEKLKKFLVEGKNLLEQLVNNIEADLYDFSCAQALKNSINELGTSMELSGKALFFPIRIALSARSAGPDLGLIMKFLGKTEVLTRLKKAIS
jgi:nondiscriminating glutamyl-tRNA synthetase